MGVSVDSSSASVALEGPSGGSASQTLSLRNDAALDLTISSVDFQLVGNASITGDLGTSLPITLTAGQSIDLPHDAEYEPPGSGRRGGRD